MLLKVCVNIPRRKGCSESSDSRYAFYRRMTADVGREG